MKKYILLVLTIFCFLLVTACSSNSNEQASSGSAELEVLQSEVAALESQNAALEEQIETLESKNAVAQEQIISLQAEISNKVVDSTTPDDSTPAEENSDSKFIIQNLGDTLELDFVAMTYGDIQWYDDIKPRDTSSVYSYTKGNENQSFIALRGTIKNLSGAAYSVENMAIEFVIDDKYTYNGRLNAEGQDGRDFYGDYLNPFEETTYYIYAEIPDELKDSYAAGVVKFAFNEDFAGSSYDDFDEMSNFYQIAFAK